MWAEIALGGQRGDRLLLQSPQAALLVGTVRRELGQVGATLGVEDLVQCVTNVGRRIVDFVAGERPLLGGDSRAEQDGKAGEEGAQKEAGRTTVFDSRQAVHRAAVPNRH